MTTTIRSGRHGTTARSSVPVTRTLLLRRLRALEHHLPRAAAGEDRSIHQARVASRRLREALPALGLRPRARRKAGRTLRRITRALGAAREMDVAVAILDELAARPSVPRSAVEDVRARVVLKRDRRRDKMRQRLDRVDPGKLRRRLLTALMDDDAAVIDPWRDGLTRRLTTRAAKLGRAVDAAGRVYAPEQLHAVRIAVKKLRYALELAADARIAGARPLVPLLKRVQETLGRLHDLQVLQHHVASVQAHPPPRLGAEDGGLDVLARVLDEECRHLHARYSKGLPALGGLVETCRRELVRSPEAARHAPAARRRARVRAPDEYRVPPGRLAADRRGGAA